MLETHIVPTSIISGLFNWDGRDFILERSNFDFLLDKSSILLFWFEILIDRALEIIMNGAFCFFLIEPLHSNIHLF